MIGRREVDRDPGYQTFESASPHTSELTFRLTDQIHAKRLCRKFGVGGVIAGFRSDRNE